MSKPTRVSHPIYSLLPMETGCGSTYAKLASFELSNDEGVILETS